MVYIAGLQGPSGMSPYPNIIFLSPYGNFHSIHADLFAFCTLSALSCIPYVPIFSSSVHSSHLSTKTCFCLLQSPAWNATPVTSPLSDFSSPFFLGLSISMNVVYYCVFVECCFIEMLNIFVKPEWFFFLVLRKLNISPIHFQSHVVLGSTTELSRLWINVIDGSTEMFWLSLNGLTSFILFPSWAVG